MIEKVDPETYMAFGDFGTDLNTVCFSFEDYFLNAPVEARIIYIDALIVSLQEYLQACGYERAMSE